MTTSPIIASRACKLFVFGPMPSMLSAKFFNPLLSPRVQHLPETCAEMCRPSSSVTVLANPASMREISSFFLWKTLTNSVSLPAFRFSHYDLRLTVFPFSDVPSCVLPATHPVVPAVAPNLPFDRGVHPPSFHMHFRLEPCSPRACICRPGPFQRPHVQISELITRFASPPLLLSANVLPASPFLSVAPRAALFPAGLASLDPPMTIPAQAARIIVYRFVHLGDFTTPTSRLYSPLLRVLRQRCLLSACVCARVLTATRAKLLNKQNGVFRLLYPDLKRRLPPTLSRSNLSRRTILSPSTPSPRLLLLMDLGTLGGEDGEEDALQEPEGDLDGAMEENGVEEQLSRPPPPPPILSSISRTWAGWTTR